MKLSKHWKVKSSSLRKVKIIPNQLRRYLRLVIKRKRHTSVDILMWDIVSIKRSVGSHIQRKPAKNMLRVNVKEIVAQEDILKHVNGLEDQLVAEEKRNVISHMTQSSVVGRKMIR